MSRYIDADSLYRRVKEKTNPYGKPTLDYESGVKVLRMIENEPTADVVEVVRCKDCKESEVCPDTLMWCNRINNLVPPNGYCHCGERKER